MKARSKPAPSAPEVVEEAQTISSARVWFDHDFSAACSVRFQSIELSGAVRIFVF